MKSIYELELHEQSNIEGSAFFVFRVPGGWLYYSWGDVGNGSVSLFVPFSKEFQEKPKKEKSERVEEESDKALGWWNSLAQNCGLAKVLKLSPKRRKGVEARLKEAEFVWARIVDEVQSSQFLRGGNDRGWKVHFDFVFLSPDNYLKILEGKYRDKKGYQPPKTFDMMEAGEKLQQQSKKA